MALLDTIIEILNINCGNLVQCSGYASEIEGLFYLLFFPTVFIILVIYILTNFIFRADSNASRGIRVLISVTLYAFIVFEGYYNLFIPLSRFWWIMLILVFGFWAFMRHLIGGKGGGGGTSSLSSIGGGALGKFAKGKLVNTFTHQEEDLEKEINDAFKTLEHFYNEVKNNPAGSDARRGASDGFERVQTRLRELITRYGSFGKVGDLKVIDQAKPYWDKYEKWSEKYRNISKKDKK